MHRQTARQLSWRLRAGPTLPLWVALFTLAAAASGSQAQSARNAIADQPAALDDEPLEQYRAYRRMHAENERFDREAWLEAWTEFDGRTFQYQIVSERGSEYVLDRVLKRLLEREQELIAEGQAYRAEFSEENYDFVEPASNGDGVRYILLKPKRKDILLVDGRMVLNEEGTEVLRVEGRLAKNPSFWTSLVNVIREFAVINGARVPVTTESVAKVKLAGTSRMTVQYEYESVNGEPVNMSARSSSRAGAVSR